MNRKTSILIAILVSLMITVPLAYGATASTSIGNNEVVFEPDNQGGISIGGLGNNSVVNPTTQDGHPAFRIQTGANNEHLIPGGATNVSFSIEIPAGVSFCLKIDAGQRLISKSSISMEVDGEDYEAVTETGIRYYSPGKVKADGVSMIPVQNFNDAVFYTSEETIKINGVANRPNILPGIFPDLKMYVLYEN